MGQIKTADLIYLNEAAKALKQNNFQYLSHGNVIIGYDNLDSYTTYVKLDENMFYVPELNGCVVSSRELSAFIKSICLETEFELKWNSNNSLAIASMTGLLVFRIENIHLGYTKFTNTELINNLPVLCPEEQVNETLANAFALRKADGAIYYKHHGKYFMTLFSGLMNVSKTDKVYLTLFDYRSINQYVFVARFVIHKKKFKVNVFIGYRYV